MTATYTFDVFSSLDGFGAHRGNWGGYWGRQGPELLDHRLALKRFAHSGDMLTIHHRDRPQWRRNE
jgi:hypothetical protein